jgi:hypothetical protein
MAEAGRMSASVCFVCLSALSERTEGGIDQSFCCLFNWQDNDINCPKLDIKFLSYML